MEAASLNPKSEIRNPKPTQFRLRQDLQYSTQQHQGKTYLVVKDPVARRYFRFTETQAAILEVIRSEAATAETTSERAAQKLGAPLSPAAIAAFFDSLNEKYLLDTPETREKLGALEGRKLQERNLLYWKLASINPERVFAWLLPRTEWMFTRGFHVFAVFTILTGLLITWIHWERIAAAAPSLFSLYGLIAIWPVVFCVTTIHEFSHGLACCRYGGKVHEVGFMLIYFQPAFFCDVSDSWMFPSRRRRMFVTLAGGYVQLVVWGLATVVWRVTDSDAFVNQLALIIILYSGLQTLVNFNPLIKLDGYYMLSDYLEIPNLRAKALDRLWRRVAGRPVPADGLNRPMLIYAIASFVFSTSLLLYVYSALYTWSTSTYALAGLVGFVMFSSLTLRKTAAESVAGVKALGARAAMKKYRNLLIGSALVFASFVIPWELKVSAEFKILAIEEMPVHVETSGNIAELMVRENSVVRKGDLLARLSSVVTEERLAAATFELERKKHELAEAERGARPEEIERQRRAVLTKETELANTARNEETRNQRRQELAREQALLKLDQQLLDQALKGVNAGVMPRTDLEARQSAVESRELAIKGLEAQIRQITEQEEREADLIRSELEEEKAELKLMLAGTRPEVIEQLRADVNRLSAQLDLLTRERAKTEIRAPIDGKVTTPFVEQKLNQFLESGQELLRLLNTSRVRAEMMVPEKELADVRLGNDVWMRVRKYANRDFHGRVDFIASAAETVDGRQMLAVRAELPNEDQALQANLTGVAKIYCGKRRIIDLMTRRLRMWIHTEFWDLLP